MKTLRNIMFAGTGSDVGKSVIAAAFCRIFRQDGYTPAPFKAQNMALNSFATIDNLEIGRAQAVQAEAAGIPCHTDMNPILLKPQSDHTSQVVLNGKPIGNQDAYTYFRGQGKDYLRREACEAFDRLAAHYNPIVLEGAGSISELNLRDRDIVNMPMAHHADAAVVLVGDIDRGGIFASLYGSMMLQTPKDKNRIKGIIINKFRGDLHLFDEGRQMIEHLCGVPVLGVVPYLHDIGIEQEDSVVTEKMHGRLMNDKVNIAVVRLRHMSNFTDFDALDINPCLNMFYTTDKQMLAQADMIIIPGSKSTIDDMLFLRETGLDQAICQAYDNCHTKVVGICGGYQLMGKHIADPECSEGTLTHIDGLGLLPVSTTLTNDKHTCQSAFTINGCSTVLHGYEIHTGITRPSEGHHITPLVTKTDGTTDGCLLNHRCMGTYMHGIFDNADFCNFLFGKSITSTDYRQYKETHYNRLAAHVRHHVNMQLVYQILNDD